MTRASFPPDGRDRDDAEEIRHHIDEKTDLLIAMGWDATEARREAERTFGDVQRIQEEMRRARASRFASTRLGFALRSIAADVRHALRSGRLTPTFTAALVATIGLGIGTAAATFTVVDALMLRPLPYRSLDRLVELNQASRQSRGYTPGIPTDRIDRWRIRGSDFADAWVGWSLGTTVRTDGPSAEELRLVAVTPGADTILGIPLLMGRGYTADDARPGATDVAILGRGYYERLGGDPDILGQTLRLESGPVVVVGVLRGGIRFPNWGGETDLWVPLRADFTALDRELRWIAGFWARLRPDVGLDRAQARADLLAERLQEQDPREDGWRVKLERLGAHRMNAEEQRVLWILSATVAALFLIACVNGINLLLVRASARRRELAIRLSVGGSLPRLFAQLLTEGLVLGSLGGAVGLALAVWSVGAVRGLVPWVVSYSSPWALEVDVRTVVFVSGASLLVGAVLGLVPAVEVLGRGGLAGAVGRSGDETVDRRRLRNGLVIAQVALSMTLLVAAGLLVRSFVQLVRSDPGYDYGRVAVALIGLSPTRYPGAADRAAFFTALEERLERAGGIEAVSYVDAPGFRSGAALEAEGVPIRADQPYRIPSAHAADDYLEVTGTDLVEGRGFVAGDAEAGAAIIDHDLARFLWGRDSALGRRFRVGEQGEWLTVVGVVRELRLMGRDQREGPYQMLLPPPVGGAGRWVQVAVRAVGDPRSVLGTIRTAVQELDPAQPIWRLRTAAEALAEAEEVPRFAMTLMAILAGVAMTLAAIGLYGVLSYSVTCRNRELGIRTALGARRARVLGMVISEGVALAVVGLVLGTCGALLTSRALGGLLYEVDPQDPLTLAATALGFLALALTASLVPAHRATRVDPVEVLRAE